MLISTVVAGVYEKLRHQYPKVVAGDCFIEKPWCAGTCRGTFPSDHWNDAFSSKQLFCFVYRQIRTRQYDV